MVSLLLAAAMVVGSCAGCGTSSSASGTSAASKAASSKTATSSKAPVVKTVGPSSGTHFEMWDFVDVHSQFYAEMVNEWNKLHPDKQINVTFTTYPYADMHNKLKMAVQTGTGAPDMCDIEIGQFPVYLSGTVPFREMNDVIAQYKSSIVQSRLSIYSKDGKNYGIPTHVGATVMYYNTEILSKYGVDYTKIKTWDDYTAAAKKVKAGSNGKVTMTDVDTGGTDWLSLSLAENKTDYTDASGKANVNVSAIKDMLTMQKQWKKDGLAADSPGGQLDTEEGYAAVGDGKVASFPRALWYMSRFLNYLPDQSGKWAIAPCPVYKEGQPRSVGIGGTGTVVMKTSKNADLAAQWLAWAKLSKEGTTQIWKILGFDPTNMSLWTDKTITQDKTNKYIKYFKTNPFDVLNEIKDEIGAIKSVSITPTVNEQLNTNVLPGVFDNNKDIDSALKDAQSAIEQEES
ncbi:MAG: extracellular solute-binding protein [Oscillospiraceae bacterium]|nr:extracellular solute-binding protein [Oscillospiraceae bacterium]